MHHDLLIRTFLAAGSLLFLAPELRADPESSSTLVDNVATLEATVVESDDIRSVIIREEAIQQSIVPSIATRKAESETVEKPDRLLPSVDTISGAEIRTHQRFGVENIVRQSAGVSLVQTGQAGSAASLFVRGLESNHTVVLLNGRRLPPGLAGLYQLEFLDVSNLESFQLLRGGASSLYGSDAVAGAINLISTDARYVERDTIQTYLESGSFSTVRSGGKITLRDGPVGIALDAGFVDTNNDRPMSPYDNRNLRGSLAIDLADGLTFDFLGYVQDSFLQVPGSSRSLSFPQNQLNNNESSLFSPRFTLKRDDWDLSVFFSKADNELTATNAPFFSDSQFEQESRETEAQFNWQPRDGSTLTLGAGHFDYEFKRTPIIPGPFNQPADFRYSYSSYFAQLDTELPAGFHLLASGRYDDHDEFAGKGTYSIQVSHHSASTGTTLFAKTSTGYKVPSGQDFIFLDPSTDPTTLTPEESISREAGIRQELFDGRDELSVTWFRADAENLVDSVFSFTTFTSFAAIVDTETSGFEVEYRSRPCECAEFYANYTYLDANVVSGTYFTIYNPGERLIRRPRHTLSGGILFSGDRWNLGAEVEGAFDRADNKATNGDTIFVDNYLTARLFGDYALSDSIDLYGRIENVFDEQYELTRGYEVSGFGIFAGFRVLLGN